MPTFMGWTEVTIPSNPPAPQSIEISVVNIVSGNTSPFTGQQQIYDWQANYLEARVNMPPMPFAVFQNWSTFLKALDGIANVFQFTSAFQAAYPGDIGSGVFWRLKSNTVSWAIGQNHIYTLSFEIRQAL